MKKGEKVVLWILVGGAIILGGVGLYYAKRARTSSKSTDTSKSKSPRSGSGDPGIPTGEEVTPVTSKSK